MKLQKREISTCVGQELTEIRKQIFQDIKCSVSALVLMATHMYTAFGKRTLYNLKRAKMPTCKLCLNKLD